LSSAAIHIVDDDADFRESLRLLLELKGFTVEEYTDAQAFAKVAAAASGCALVDVNMPGMDGISLSEALVRDGARVPIVIMTGNADIPMAVRAMRAGAVDFIVKPLDHEKLMEAIERALQAAPAEDPALAAFRARLPNLSPREMQILAAVVGGHPTKVIAYRLDISPRTVHAHRLSIGEKLGVTGLSNLVRLALAAGVRPE
jgi:two-component system response regulator FixJ